jgi:zinc protease
MRFTFQASKFKSARAWCALTLTVLFGLAFLSVRSPADEPSKKQNEKEVVAQAAAALYEGIREEVLPNGLHVYLKPVPESPVVTTMVAYRVGSADENLDHTGLSHYLEHLMFKGTEKIMPGDIDRLTLRNGGANNAATSEDHTIYHFDFAADRWEKALEVEADRMRNIRIDARHEFEQEKGAVIAELEQGEDQPWDIETKMILPVLFGNGPYGHPVIGERDQVRGATANVIKSHYDKWYYPNNASLVVCGGFDPDKALAKIKELFGPLPKGDLPERKPAVEVKRKGPVHKEMVSKFESPRLLLGYNTVRTGHPDFYVLEVIKGLLASGKTGRLYRRMVEQDQLAVDVGCSAYGGRYPGWFELNVELLKGKELKQTENVVLEELKKLADKPVEAAELKRVIQGIVAAAVFSRESVHGLADSIAQGVTTNDLDYLKTYLTRIQAVSAEDVQRVARTYFDPEQRVVVRSLPQQGARRNNAIGKQEEGTAMAGRGSAGVGSSAAHRLLRRLDSGGNALASLKDAKRIELPNGLVLLLYENRRLPIVSAGAVLRHVLLHEDASKAGVAALTGSLLDEGTTRHSGQEIAEMIENVGGSLSLSEAGGTVKVLSSDRSLGLGLLFECLMQANFPDEAFKRKKLQQLSNIDDSERQPDRKAQMVYHRLVYGQHPLGRPTLGTRKTVEGLTEADCREFYRKVFLPNNTIVAIVGDFDSKQVVDEVTRLTAEWQKAELSEPKLPEVEKPEHFSEHLVMMPQAAQLHFLMGHVGIRRNNPDYYKLLVMDYVLGTGPGFTDRLSSRLRDREGLGYTVSANITDSAGLEPGLFTCYIGTTPPSFARVKQIFLEELARIRKEKPSEEEVEDAKKYLLGSLPFRLTTNDRIAGMLLNVERYQLGLGYLDDYRKAVSSVTAEQVHEVAQKYIDPEHMVLVAAGALDKDGKPLPQLAPPKK